MVTLSAFGDEIAADLTEQMDVLETEDVRYIELRSVWRKSVLDLDNRQLDMIKEELEEREFGISAIGSPIGKVAIDGDQEEHLRRFQRALDAAGVLGTDYIRIFSFYLPEGEPPDLYRDAVMDRLRSFYALAEEERIVLLHENEKRIYGETPERCEEIFEAIDTPFLRATFDIANFIQAGVRPYEDAFPRLKDKIEYMHIKDARLSDGQVVPVGQGDGRVRELLADLLEEGFDGFLCVEPHLSGMSGPDAFRTAVQALKEILDDIGAEYV